MTPPAARRRSQFIDAVIDDYAAAHSTRPDADQLELQRITREKTGRAAGMQIGDDQAVLMEMVGGRAAGSLDFSGDGTGPEALDDQPDAEGELPGSYREGRDRRECGDVPGAAAEQRGDDGGDEQRGADEPEHGDDAGHEPGPVHQGAQQQRVDARHEGLAEQERPVVERDVGCAGGDERGGIRSGRSAKVVPQGHQREQADDAGEDHAAFNDAGGDEAERGAFVLPLDYRVQRDGGADAGQGDDHLEEGAREHAGVAAGSEDPVPTRPG